MHKWSSNMEVKNIYIYIYIYLHEMLFAYLFI